MGPPYRRACGTQPVISTGNTWSMAAELRPMCSS
jgi:hypothetical protein